MPAGDVRFVSLADALRSRPIAAESPATCEIVPIDAPPPSAPVASPLVESVPTPQNPSEQAAAIVSARLFRAAVGDAVDAIVCDLARDIAVEIVARELRLAKADLAAIARRLIAERFAEQPLRLRVASADADIACDLPVTVDPALAPGDAVLECRDGDIDARLGVRLAAVLAAVQA